MPKKRISVTIERQKVSRHEAIVGYAAKMAGTRADLDQQLKRASLDTWDVLKQPRERKR